MKFWLANMGVAYFFNCQGIWSTHHSLSWWKSPRCIE